MRGDLKVHESDGPNEQSNNLDTLVIILSTTDDFIFSAEMKTNSHLKLGGLWRNGRLLSLIKAETPAAEEACEHPCRSAHTESSVMEPRWPFVHYESYKSQGPRNRPPSHNIQLRLHRQMAAHVCPLCQQVTGTKLNSCCPLSRTWGDAKLGRG